MIDFHYACGTIAYLDGNSLTLPQPFVWSWTQMVQFTPEAVCQDNNFVHFDRAKHSGHAYARNELVRKMRGDWLLQFDTDLTFEPDTAARLIGLMYKYDLDVLTGVYCYKSHPHLPVIYMYNHKTERHEVIGEFDKNLQLVQVDSAGGGCLLVRRRVFEQMREKFEGEEPFDQIGKLGEDHSFFRRLSKLGMRAYCCPQIQLNHLTWKEVSINDRNVAISDLLVGGEGLPSINEYPVHFIPIPGAMPAVVVPGGNPADVVENS